MKSRWRFECLLMAILFVALSAGVVLAQDQSMAPPPPADNSVQQADLGQQGYPAQPGNPGQQGYPAQQGAQQMDPPGRVARVQYMTGEVSMQPGGVNDWVAANLNRPLTTSDRVWTDKDSRAELNVGDGFIRMNSETSLTLTNVSDSTVQLELDQGTLNLTVRHLEKGEVFEIDTPNYAFTVMKTGVYRFDVVPSQDQSWVTVRSGYGEATGKGAAVRVNSGTQVRFSSGNSLQHAVYSAPTRDSFEDWAQVRDKRLDDSLSARYVSPGVIGYQDLDAYGTWTTTPDYGPVWTPTSVPAGWAPYRYGQWTWIAPWGWTWVDSAPWGFAPFHYGRWVSYGGGWGWSPGPLGYWNPYYAPALVGWIGGPGFGIGFGWGGGWGFGIGIGFGWYPLGWGAPYYPHYCGWGHGGWYRGGGYVTAGYFHNVNVTNTHITNINNAANNYHNGNFGNTSSIAKNGVTSASKAAFTSGAAVNKVGGAVPASALNNAHTLSSANVNPTKSSVLGGQTPRTNVPSAASANRSVVTRATPPARPASFSSAQSATARGNSNSTGNGASNVGTSANAAHNGVNGANTGAHNTQAMGGSEHSANGTQTQARGNVSSNPANNVARPPSAGGSNTPGSSNATQSHNVPRPPSSNDGFARPNGSTANSGNDHNATTANNQRYGTNNSTASSRSSSQSSNSGRGSASSVPRPPANYSYHAAPSYSASGAYGAGRSGSYGGSSRGYSSSPGYNSGRAYGGSTQGYSAGRGYGSSPTYTARNYGSAPSYGGRSAGSYSAPHSSAGSYHGSSGGGYHGGGGGGHSGGGGGHR